MFADSGNRYIYDIKNFNPEANLPESYFIFDIDISSACFFATLIIPFEISMASIFFALFENLGYF